MRKMNKITAFDRNNLNDLLTQIKAKLSELEAETGVALKIGNVRFTGTQFSTKLTGAIIPATGVDHNPGVAEYVRDYEANRAKLNLPKDLIGAKFRGLEGEYTFVGTKARNHKYPVIARKPDGTLVKVNVVSVIRGLLK